MRLGGAQPTLTNANLCLGYLDSGCLPRRQDGARSPAQTRAPWMRRSPAPLRRRSAARRMGHPRDDQRGRRPRVSRACFGTRLRLSSRQHDRSSADRDRCMRRRVARKLRCAARHFPDGNRRHVGVRAARQSARPSRWRARAGWRAAPSLPSSCSYLGRDVPACEETLVSLLVRSGVEPTVTRRAAMRSTCGTKGKATRSPYPDPRNSIPDITPPCPAYSRRPMAGVFCLVFAERPIEIVNWKVEANGPPPDGPTGTNHLNSGAAARRGRQRRSTGLFGDAAGLVPMSGL